MFAYCVLFTFPPEKKVRPFGRRGGQFPRLRQSISRLFFLLFSLLPRAQVRELEPGVAVPPEELLHGPLRLDVTLPALAAVGHPPY